MRFRPPSPFGLILFSTQTCFYIQIRHTSKGNTAMASAAPGPFFSSPLLANPMWDPEITGPWCTKGWKPGNAYPGDRPIVRTSLSVSAAYKKDGGEKGKEGNRWEWNHSRGGREEGSGRRHPRNTSQRLRRLRKLCWLGTSQAQTKDIVCLLFLMFSQKKLYHRVPNPGLLGFY